MRYFSAAEILRSSAIFSIFGVSVGLLYFIFFINTRKVAMLPLCIVYVLKSKSFSPHVTPSANRLGKATAKILISIYEFCFFTLIGAIYILLTYVLCDGVARVYPIIITLLFAYLAYKVIALALRRIINTALDKIYQIEYAVIYAILYPIRYVIRRIKAILMPIFVKAMNKQRERRFKKQINKKYKEQALILKHILNDPKKTEGQI